MLGGILLFLSINSVSIQTPSEHREQNKRNCYVETKRSFGKTEIKHCNGAGEGTIKARMESGVLRQDMLSPNIPAQE